MTLTIEAPTDAQLDYIGSLCRRAEVPLPDVVALKAEAHRIIDALKDGSYSPDDYRYDEVWGWDEVRF